MTTLNELAAEIHAISKEKLFWEGHRCPNKYCTTTIGRSPAEALLLISSEAVEAFEALRDGYAIDDDATDWISGPNVRSHAMAVSGNQHILTEVDGQPCHPPRVVTDEVWAELGFEPKPVGVPSELADIIIRTLDTAAAWGIDIDAIVQRKIAYNRTRPALHGRKA